MRGRQRDRETQMCQTRREIRRGVRDREQMERDIEKEEESGDAGRDPDEAAESEERGEKEQV